MLLVIRFFDLVISVLIITFFSPIYLVIGVASYLQFGSAIFFQTRIGQNEQPFELLKFRSMPCDAPEVATHLLPKKYLTRFGMFLRATKLDELPQLWNVLIGQMSIVGPRPNLIGQSDLRAERHRLKVYSFRPGITGLAQVQGIDMSCPTTLAEIDRKMISEFSIGRYFKLIGLTVMRFFFKVNLQRYKL